MVQHHLINVSGFCVAALWAQYVRDLVCPALARREFFKRILSSNAANARKAGAPNCTVLKDHRRLQGRYRIQGCWFNVEGWGLLEKCFECA